MEKKEATRQVTTILDNNSIRNLDEGIFKCQLSRLSERWYSKSSLNIVDGSLEMATLSKTTYNELILP